MMRKIILLAAAILTLGLAGCNTFAGAGKDIERGGEVVQDAARDVQKKL
ncbi:entericidin A/B family lipoprotein [Oceanimonas smirnovii]|uniref:Entericidin A/B family lipoprotein n=1 Tax=Oceanimonas smirnovii TaxID=264574 RepID=A0ABW7P189_9GAMM